MFHLTIDCESSCSVGVIAAMSEIENNEGLVIVDPKQLFLFLGSIANGLSTKIDYNRKARYIVGNMRGQTEDWESVSGILRAIADDIDHA